MKPDHVKARLRHADAPKGAGKVRARRFARRVARCALRPGTRYVVRPCDEPDGTRTWDVFEITPGERELARIEERPAGPTRASNRPATGSEGGQ